jgi:calcium permeable stress-gated cation channel
MSYIDPLHSGRTPVPSNSLFGWFSDFKKLPDEHVLQHSSLDGYLFLRYMKMLTIIAFVGCCITWPILFPINATGGGGQEQLDLLSFSNVADPYRYYAHALVSWVFMGMLVFPRNRTT